MQTITEMALVRASGGVFTREQAGCWVGERGARLDGLLKRAVGSGEVRRVCRGLYCLSAQYPMQPVNPLGLAQRIHGPSYISLESALSYHGWIPEAVRAITSTSMGRSREFDTPLGLFTFTRVPQEGFLTGVTRIAGAGDDAFFLANPLKALSDYVYVTKLDWVAAEPLVESLRVDEEELRTLNGDMFDELTPVYKSARVHRFLTGLRKDLKV